MNTRMNNSQRIVLIVAAIGWLHSSMVPPVVQAPGGTCRYHEFVERQWPYTLGYEVADADLAALVSEYGMLVAVAVTLFLVLGRFRRT